MSLPELLERAAASPTGAVDVDRLWHRGRRRRRRVQAAAGGGVAALAIAGALLLIPEPGGVVLVPGLPPETASALPLPPPSAAPTEAPPADWPDLTLAEALERLITVNESAPAGLADGVRVTRTVHASRNTDGGTGASTLGIDVHEARRTPDGYGTTWRAPVAEGLDPAASPERLRAIVAATDLDGLVLELEYDLSEGVIPSEAGPNPTIEDMLALAEEFAATVLPSPLPSELETKRPPHASAADAVIDTLRQRVPSPQQRIRALHVLAGLDPSVVQYGGVARDLLGREGIAIVLLDPPIEGRRATLTFSPDTGELLGSFTESAPAIPGQLPSYYMEAVLLAEIRPQ